LQKYIRKKLGNKKYIKKKKPTPPLGGYMRILAKAKKEVGMINAAASRG
jgi:hypothetical protein